MISTPDKPPNAGRTGSAEQTAVGAVHQIIRRPLAVVCLCFLAVVVGVSIVAPWALPHVAGQRAGDLLRTSETPSGRHWLGTDTLGRDVVQRLLVGSRVTMVGTAEALLVVLLLGVSVGLVAGFYGGWTDRLVTWLADLTFSIPAIVIIIVVLSVFPGSMLAAMCTLGVLAAPGLMRLVRAATLQVREELYVDAAQVAGLSRTYILTRHLLPRVLGPVLVQASLLAGVALLVQTGLAFLGLLVHAPAPSWGGMVADGSTVIVSHPWLIWPPGIAIALTALAFALLGDVIRDVTVATWSNAGAMPTTRAGHGTRGRRHATSPAAVSTTPDALLSVESLAVAFDSPRGPIRVVDSVTFDIKPGEAVGIVGETGCGKSITAAAVLGLLPTNAFIQEGQIWLGRQDLASAREDDLRHIRGKRIAFISQEPLVGLDPAFRVGAQLAEVARQHNRLSRKAAQARALQLLETVRLPNPAVVARRYPHELSGGMAQRVAIARALAGAPQLLIADEPTTALDVTIQAEILALFRQLQRDLKMAILLITHDWGVVADICDRAIVMYGGQIVERTDINRIFETPMHPYTKALLASNPHNSPSGSRLPTIPGSVPSPGTWPEGCRFQSRCSFATAECGDHPIPLQHPEDGRETRCLHFDELTNR